jgi:hypothetical protein
LPQLDTEEETMLLYDMEVEDLGVLRVAEHFTVENGKITHIRQIHGVQRLQQGVSVTAALPSERIVPR